MPSKKPMLRQIKWGVWNGPITRSAVLPVPSFLCEEFVSV